MNRASPPESLQRIVEPGVGEDRRMDAARDLPQLIYHCDEIVCKTRQLLHGRFARCGEAGSLPRSERERNEPLLSPVMEIPLEPTARLVGRADETGARRQ